MTERDPRVNPKAGDVLRDATGWTYTVLSRKDEVITSDMTSMGGITMPLVSILDGWIGLLKEEDLLPVEVIHASE